MEMKDLRNYISTKESFNELLKKQSLDHDIVDLSIKNEIYLPNDDFEKLFDYCDKILPMIKGNNKFVKIISEINETEVYTMFENDAPVKYYDSMKRGEH